MNVDLRGKQKRRRHSLTSQLVFCDPLIIYLGDDTKTLFWRHQTLSKGMDEKCDIFKEKKNANVQCSCLWNFTSSSSSAS